MHFALFINLSSLGMRDAALDTAHRIIALGVMLM